MYELNWYFESLDQWRRWQGTALDAAGFGPDESDFHYVLERPGVRLRCYSAGSQRPSLLIVPAPIKSPSIWDLQPSRSVVRWALDRGFEVYLAEWTRPQADTALLRLEDYAGTLLDECVAAIRQHAADSPVVLAGHSLGGTFAALYSAWRPEQVAGLVLVEAPLKFGEASGDFKKTLRFDLPPDTLFPGASRVPGSALSTLAAGASPTTFVAERQTDFFLSHMSPEALQTHWRALRWTLDELPLARGLFEDVVECLYRNDDFMHGELQMHDQLMRPSQITSPLLAIFDPASRVIPAEAVLEPYHHVSSTHKKLLNYRGDRGVALQHVGSLIGENAHKEIWPEVFRWLKQLPA